MKYVPVRRITQFVLLVLVMLCVAPVFAQILDIDDPCLALPDSNLNYRFDTGYHGRGQTVRFRSGNKTGFYVNLYPNDPQNCQGRVYAYALSNSFDMQNNEGPSLVNDSIDGLDNYTLQQRDVFVLDGESYHLISFDWSGDVVIRQISMFVSAYSDGWFGFAGEAELQRVFDDLGRVDPISIGQQVSTELTFGSDTYEVYLEENEAVTIEVESVAFDTTLEIKDANGRLEYNDDYYRDRNQDSRIDFVAPYSGRFQITVSAYSSLLSGAGSGWYTLSLSELEVIEPVAVSVGDVVEGEISRGGDFYPIHLLAGRTVVIETSDIDFDTIIWLLDSDGLEVSINDDFGSGHESRIEYEVLEDGDYTIEVQSYDGYSQGAYTLSIWYTVDPIQIEVVPYTQSYTEETTLAYSFTTSDEPVMVIATVVGIDEPITAEVVIYSQGSVVLASQEGENPHANVMSVESRTYEVWFTIPETGDQEVIVDIASISPDELHANSLVSESSLEFTGYALVKLEFEDGYQYEITLTGTGLYEFWHGNGEFAFDSTFDDETSFLMTPGVSHVYLWFYYIQDTATMKLRRVDE